MLNLFEPSREVNEALNCLLEHKNVKGGKNIKFCYDKKAYGSVYLSTFVNHLEKAHKISVQMVKDQATVTSGSKMFNLTKEPQKETVQVFLRERSRLRGDNVTPLFEYLTTETSNEFVLYELLPLFAFSVLKFFTANLQDKTFTCRLDHKKSLCVLKGTIHTLNDEPVFLYYFKHHLNAAHNLSVLSLENMVKNGCSPAIKTILEGPLVSLNYN